MTRPGHGDPERPQAAGRPGETGVPQPAVKPVFRIRIANYPFQCLGAAPGLHGQAHPLRIFQLSWADHDFAINGSRI
jgi:hypothetical protein